MSWFFLGLAILSELIGTLSMKMSVGFTRFWPSLSLVVCYGLSSVSLTLALRTIPLGTAYAIWSGVGTACAVAIGVVLFQEAFTPVKIASTALIVIGVLGLRLG